VPRLLDHLRATYAPSSPVTYDRAFDRFLNAPVLILDDYGTHSSKPWAEEKLFQLINHRFNARLPTVITTNIPFDQPEQLPPAGQQELRVYSRILDPELARIVRIDAPHFRRPELDLKKRRDRTW
jgi:DNA replication protein DnaC